jgi:NAD(P)-dependent dehydrogenase (short-subunit alcohol dehydrogenase family)
VHVVVGGASGIGAAVAAVLPGGALVADRAGGDVQCDVTDAASLDRLAGGVDALGALVVTAGVSPTMADARTILDVDLAGTARVLQAFDGLVGTGTVVVCLASIAGHLGRWPDDVVARLDEPLTAHEAGLTDDPATAYLLAKHGVLRLVRRLAVPYGRRGARIVSVSPGVVDTAMGRAELAAGTGAPELVGGSAQRRVARPGEVADVVAFLCSPAAAHVTGCDLLVDGGTVASLG